ncbi:hypothetical protein AUP44_27320 [Tistrella mobilis]|uniref:Uncharacterized protein n=1 Tax=Tistrella mobilis TaxID=171437 RepID=A0A162L2Z7_9PROT|nr:hypothetical protein AUP44_27320 [Tistrella mobilis]
MKARQKMTKFTAMAATTLYQPATDQMSSTAEMAMTRLLVVRETTIYTEMRGMIKYMAIIMMIFWRGEMATIY